MKNLHATGRFWSLLMLFLWFQEDTYSPYHSKDRGITETDKKENVHSELRYGERVLLDQVWLIM